MKGVASSLIRKSPHHRTQPPKEQVPKHGVHQQKKMGPLAPPATAREISVLPVPGAPTRRTPLGIRAPISVKREGCLRKSTISSSSIFASSTPATSLKRIEGRDSLKRLAFDRAKGAACPPIPERRMMK